MATRILLLTGMKPDARVFDRLLPLLPAADVVPWIEPQHRESLRNYARRLAETVDSTGPLSVCGVSFGGIVARELALQLRAQKCVLVSSVRTHRDFPPWMRAVRAFAGPGFELVLSAVGAGAEACPRRMRQPSTTRLRKFAGQSGAWHRWATSAALRWHASPELDRVPTVQIHGEYDETFPLRYVQPDIVFAGGHLLVMTHAHEIANVLLRDL